MISLGSGLDRLANFASASHWRVCLLLVLLSLGAFLPGFTSLQPFDRDEPRFAQASKQMLETRDFVDIRFQDEARHKKPVGIYWLQAGSVAIGEALGVPQARTTMWLYRLPSLIGAIATVLLTYWALLAFVGTRLALLGGALMAAAVLLGVEARFAKTDALLAACAVATMGALARAWLDWTRSLAFVPSRHNWLVFWSATALGLLLKGPIVPMVWGLAVLVLAVRERSLRWFAPLRPGLGLLLCLVVVLPWFVAIAVKTGGDFFAESVGKDMLAKVGEGQEKHWGPPGLYLLLFFGTYWPSAALAAMAIPFAWVKRREPQILFLLAWIVPSWLVFEAVPTKLPHYVLPLYPAITALLLLALVNGGINRFRRGSTLTAFLVVLVPAALVGVLLYGTWTLDRTLPWLALPVLALALFVTFRGFLAFRRGAFEGALWRGVVASLLLSLGVFGLASPSLRGLKLSPRLAEAVQAVTCQNPQVMTVGYREPSLVFLVGTDLRMGADGSVAATFLREPGCRVALVEGRFLDGFRQTLAASGLAPRLLTTISGFNLNGGKRLDISVFVRE
ncbi:MULTISPECIES: glycosyltransferase family 39 protein [unclassified Bosea (in: a-proteobacteria)]|uniref:ArnT family glycosyltransferase n=1 Tax=unclassified Bosea (in: a-proteobacteria) TaxID=2653178 RepID=UPI000F753B5C|nr:MULTISPECIES: glycosyltransferase family 39 protein [unclassified Bosea (in: a-proteobacteria)]AZO77600.1 glycosyl transferase [Bosea sp. Tri-49]RXT18206.1 glycosyl transferase [Bosea sp. Tri-39]RXT32802.1 glycosyl transferase [Bosea sp. Tri-54]